MMMNQGMGTGMAHGMGGGHGLFFGPWMMLFWLAALVGVIWLLVRLLRK